LAAPLAALAASPDPATDPQQFCRKNFGGILSPDACAKFSALPSCRSADGKLIPYYEKDGRGKDQQRILVFGQIHGDEYDAGKLAEEWIQRVDRISPHNTWRIAPRLNPDGDLLKTRTNAHGVDLNRNFPTKIWDKRAMLDWEHRYHKNPRRYPGPTGGSEPETRCAMALIEDFHPDIVVSIHTPYGILDFDGPKQHLPKFGALPWHMLGTYAGSLGHYEWVDNHIPVLTVELAPSSLQRYPKKFLRLQDLISLLVPAKPRALSSSGPLKKPTR
jgi:hypothetical protein